MLIINGVTQSITLIQFTALWDDKADKMSADASLCKKVIKSHDVFVTSNRSNVCIGNRKHIEATLRKNGNY